MEITCFVAGILVGFFLGVLVSMFLILLMMENERRRR